KNRIRLIQNFIIPEPQDRKPLGNKPVVTPPVGRRKSMLPTIGLHNYPGAEVHEIDNIRTNRLLTTKLSTSQSMSTQMSPQQLFGIRHAPPKLLGKYTLNHSAPNTVTMIKT